MILSINSRKIKLDAQLCKKDKGLRHERNKKSQVLSTYKIITTSNLLCKKKE